MTEETLSTKQLDQKVGNDKLIIEETNTAKNQPTQAQDTIADVIKTQPSARGLLVQPDTQEDLLPQKASEPEKSGKVTASNVKAGGEKKERLNVPAAELKRQLVVEDSIWADFNCGRVKGSIMKAYREGKRIK